MAELSWKASLTIDSTHLLSFNQPVTRQVTWSPILFWPGQLILPKCIQAEIINRNRNHYGGVVMKSSILTPLSAQGRKVFQPLHPADDANNLWNCGIDTEGIVHQWRWGEMMQIVFNLCQQNPRTSLALLGLAISISAKSPSWPLAARD